MLSTIHSANGLEWQAAHVLALYDGNFPACMAAGSTERIDEEHRLPYAAVTVRGASYISTFISATTTGPTALMTLMDTASRRGF